MSHDDAFALPVLLGRLRRLVEELEEEAMPALVGAPNRVAGLVELADALRPLLHEGRVPSYGALLPPGPIFTPDAWLDRPAKRNVGRGGRQ